MSWLFPRKMKWRHDVLVDMATGEMLARSCACQSGWVIQKWNGYWIDDSGHLYITADDAKAAAERRFR